MAAEASGLSLATSLLHTHEQIAHLAAAENVKKCKEAK